MLEGYKLPTFSTVVLKVLNMLRDKECTMSEIAVELSLDPSLVVSVFKMVNSSAFGLVHKVNNVSQAVMLLGRARVESIVLSHAVKKALPSVKESWFDIHQFWQLAAMRATLARNFAKMLHPETAISSFTAAMLQDIGMPVLIANKGKDYSRIYDSWVNGEKDILSLEQETFSTNHQSIGQAMAETWTFPEYLVNAIGFHHNSDRVEPAIYLASNIELTNMDSDFEELIELCRDRYSIPSDKAADVIALAVKEASTISLG